MERGLVWLSKEATLSCRDCVISHWKVNVLDRFQYLYIVADSLSRGGARPPHKWESLSYGTSVADQSKIVMVYLRIV